MADKYIIAISPFIGDASRERPGAALMKSSGYEGNTRTAWHNVTATLSILFVQEVRDPVNVEGAVRFDTLIDRGG